MKIDDIIIDPEFKDLLGKQEPEEREALEESILAEGFTDPWVVWRGQNILVDGHNRYEIREESAGLVDDPDIIEMEFADRDAVKAWIIKRQLGRRNLSNARRAYFLGELHKMCASADSGRQSGARSRDVVAAQTGVGARTVDRGAAYKRDVDAIAENTGVSAGELVDRKITQTQARAIAAAPAGEQAAMLDAPAIAPARDTALDLQKAFDTLQKKTIQAVNSISQVILAQGGDGALSQAVERRFAQTLQAIAEWRADAI